MRPPRRARLEGDAGPHEGAGAGGLESSSMSDMSVSEKGSSSLSADNEARISATASSRAESRDPTSFEGCSNVSLESSTSVSLDTGEFGGPLPFDSINHSSWGDTVLERGVNGFVNEPGSTCFDYGEHFGQRGKFSEGLEPLRQVQKVGRNTRAHFGGGQKFSGSLRSPVLARTSNYAIPTLIVVTTHAK